jgi:hypothetical protein
MGGGQQYMQGIVIIIQYIDLPQIFPLPHMSSNDVKLLLVIFTYV